MSTASQKKVNFHFVTGNPQSESEKRTVRTIVRSNASNRRWRIVRESAAKSKAQSKEVDDDDNGSEKSSEVLQNGNSPVSKPAVSNRTSRRQRLNDKQARRDGRRASDSSSTSMGSPVKVKNLAEYFFGVMPASEVSKQSISRMLQGTAASYAQLFPSGKNSVVSQMAKDWFQQCLRTRGILHTALFCQAMRAQAVRPGWAAMSGNELVLCQTEAVHAINEKLLQSLTACDDESIRIVFSLTWHGAIKEEPPPMSPTQAPMADLQSLRLFLGMIACDPIHARGLDNMLALRGGLDNVEMPGLAFLVSYADILTASANLTRPTWGYGSYAQHVPEAAVNDEWLRSTHRTDHPLTTLGDGFSALHLWMPYERASQLQVVFVDMANYTRASDDFLRGPPEDRNRAIMADQRNFVQHRLMSLCLIDSDQFMERDIFDLCWLAGVAYSMIAVFPLSPKAARFDRLANMIKQAISNTTVADKWAQAPELGIWITVMGALCAIGTPNRSWFVEVLKQETDRLGIFSWQDLKMQLMDFLWFPLASDPNGQELWVEVEQQGRIVEWKYDSG